MSAMDELVERLRVERETCGKAVDTQVCIRCGLRQRFTLCADCKHVTKALGELARWMA